MRSCNYTTLYRHNTGNYHGFGVTVVSLLRGGRQHKVLYNLSAVFVIAQPDFFLLFPTFSSNPRCLSESRASAERSASLLFRSDMHETECGAAGRDHTQQQQQKTNPRSALPRSVFMVARSLGTMNMQYILAMDLPRYIQSSCGPLSSRR